MASIVEEMAIGNQEVAKEVYSSVSNMADNINKMSQDTSIEMQIKNKILVFNIKELIQMKWQEVREMYPNQFIKFEIEVY